MFDGIALTFVAAVSTPCVYMGQAPYYEAVSGFFEVIPVQQTFQTDTLKRLRSRSLLPVSKSEALVLTGRKALPPPARYYLARVGFIGKEGLAGVVPKALWLTLEVDERGTAYVMSYMLTQVRGRASLVVVLSSSRPLNRVVSICGAAE